jgi:hypothetical protein
MTAVLDFYLRIYGWISSAPLPLLAVLAVILLVTVPIAANALFAAAVALIRAAFRLFRRAGRARRTPHPFRHTTAQLVSLILLLSWAS